MENLPNAVNVQPLEIKSKLGTSWSFMLKHQWFPMTSNQESLGTFSLKGLTPFDANLTLIYELDCQVYDENWQIPMYPARLMASLHNYGLYSESGIVLPKSVYIYIYIYIYIYMYIYICI